ERAFLLSALSFVDNVVVFDEDTPQSLIKKISPDVLVKGGDYTFETIVGADYVSSYGGSVVTIPLVENFSSTNIINKFL
ncbi:MAG: bifunctional heptose 7-phosphate kinase/heptose 1-phosphate adenyltransferase, partial [Bacteroidales bacterium]|nr:bifunctional heptose 7-phosphate kinase/heptose 1-phosphate adenyltransferase [Bacteroidales bacterium]